MASKEAVETALGVIATHLKDPSIQARVKGLKQDITLTFTDLNLSYAVKVHDATVAPTIVRPGEKHQVEVMTDSETFLGIINRKIDGFSAFTSGKLKVHGSISDLLKLQGFLSALS